MKLPLFRAAFKDSKLSTIIYCGVLVFYGILLMSAFPSVKDTISAPFHENNGVIITETDNNVGDVTVYNLSWETRAKTSSHIAVGLDSDSPLIEEFENVINGTIPEEFDDLDINWNNIMDDLDSISDQGDVEPVEPIAIDANGTSIIYAGEGSYVNFANTVDSDVFIILLIPNDGNISNLSSIGPVMLMDLESISDFDKYLEDNPFVEGFLGGNEIDFSSIEGYLALEYFSMWPLLFIIFLAVKTAGTVSKHVEDRSIDILLATGYSRTRFLTEKVLLVMANLVLVTISAWLGLLLGIIIIGEAVPTVEMTLAFISSLPMALAFLGISFFISVLIDEGGKAIGIVMGVVLGEYTVSIIANLVEWGDSLKYFSLFTYWDSNATMTDMTLDPVHVLVPVSIAAITFIAAYVIFKKKEIHS